MKLTEALRMGAFCGLSTVGEAISNVFCHASSLFLYSEIDQELQELEEDILACYEDKDLGSVPIPQNIINQANAEHEKDYLKYYNCVDQDIGTPVEEFLK